MINNLLLAFSLFTAVVPQVPQDICTSRANLAKTIMSHRQNIDDQNMLELFILGTTKNRYVRDLSLKIVQAAYMVPRGSTQTERTILVNYFSEQVFINCATSSDPLTQ